MQILKKTKQLLTCSVEQAVFEDLHQANFHILAGNDIDLFTAEIFKHNYPGTQFLFSSIEEISSGNILKAASLIKGELDCLIGGQSCQTFSIYNHQCGIYDKHNGLFYEYLIIVDGL